MNYKTLLTGLFAAAFLGALPTFAADEVEPDNAIKYRQQMMKAVGGHTSAMVVILKGEVPHTEALKSHADGLAAATNPESLIAAFMQNTDGKGSEENTSTGKIWEDWARFEEAVQDLAAAAKEIQVAAAAGNLTEFDQLKPALEQCGFCHRKSGFRDKK